MTPRPRDGHYSYTVYADPDTARTFDGRRFGGPIGELVATTQARVLTNMVGRITERPILDVGTGTGRAALLFARGGAYVTGVDASEQMLAIARQRADAEGLAVKFVVGDAHALDFPDRAFDVSVSLRMLMHTPQWRHCISELCRVSERLVIVDYPSAASVALVESMARRTLGRSAEPYQVFTQKQIGDAFDRCGFAVRSVHRLFVLPIALHKLVGSQRFTLAVEDILDRMHLRGVFGSPVTLVAERCAL
ncbi:MAG: methyltransferase domain-containing protein [Acidobacteria bacterium]|nr:methyltransferase domain-containing protein [Acidobacteriota bacterium]